ncbi:hypothetical protein [Saccharopolyspora hattusasensis]|uniref:hypothetical protein n=1 Tax=Saccharopolyspora hattusasensis TaxID=1128679 RepID=UPI003D95EC49
MTVAISLFCFIVAPIRQSGDYSVGVQNLAAVEDGSCGIADHAGRGPDRGGSPDSGQPLRRAERSCSTVGGDGEGIDFSPP